MVVACKKAGTNEDQDDDSNKDGARMSSSERRRKKRAHVNVNQALAVFALQALQKSK